MSRHLFLLLLLSIPLRAPGQEPLLGVLEEIPAATTAEHNFRAVRVLFQKMPSGWQALPSNCPDQQCLKAVTEKFPPETEWTIAFDGKSLATVTAHTPQDFVYYSRVGLQEIIGKPPLPAVGKPTTEFGAAPDQPLLRPLVAISVPNFQDPDHWKPHALSLEQLALVRQQFRAKFPKLCQIGKPDEAKVEPRPYADPDIQLVKAYASNTNWFLAHVHIDDAIVCDDPEAGFQMLDPWFTLAPENSAFTYLGSGLNLIDAGDYDKSGHSQLLFSLTAANRSGFVLYYDNFFHSATFAFSYH